MSTGGGVPDHWGHWGPPGATGGALEEPPRSCPQPSLASSVVDQAGDHDAPPRVRLAQ